MRKLSGYSYLLEVYGSHRIAEFFETCDFEMEFLKKVLKNKEDYKNDFEKYKSFINSFLGYKNPDEDFMGNKYNILAFIIHTDFKVI